VSSEVLSETMSLYAFDRHILLQEQEMILDFCFETSSFYDAHEYVENFVSKCIADEKVWQILRDGSQFFWILINPKNAQHVIVDCHVGWNTL